MNAQPSHSLLEYLSRRIHLLGHVLGTGVLASGKDWKCVILVSAHNGFMAQ